MPNVTHLNLSHNLIDTVEHLQVEQTSLLLMQFFIPKTHPLLIFLNKSLFQVQLSW